MLWVKNQLQSNQSWHNAIQSNCMSTCNLLDNHPLVPFVHAVLSESKGLPKKKLDKVSGMIANAMVHEDASVDNPLGFDLGGMVVVDRGFKSQLGQTFELTNHVKSIGDTNNQCSGAAVTFNDDGDPGTHFVELSFHPPSQRGTANENEWVVEMLDMGSHMNRTTDNYNRIETCCMNLEHENCDIKLPLCNEMMQSYVSDARNLVNGKTRGGDIRSKD